MRFDQHINDLTDIIMLLKGKHKQVTEANNDSYIDNSSTSSIKIVLHEPVQKQKGQNIGKRDI